MTVNILNRRQHGQWVSHKDYLDSCSYEDLINLREFLEKRIKDIQSEEKVMIYGVMGTCTMRGWFDNYQDAYECFIDKVVPELLKENMGLDEKVGITSKKVFKSELKEYL